MQDWSGQKLAYVYYEEEPGRRSSAKLLTRDEARRIAANLGEVAGAFAELLIGYVKDTGLCNFNHGLCREDNFDFQPEENSRKS